MNRILPVLDAADAESQLAAMADGAAYVELFKDYGKEIRVALTRIGGRPAVWWLATARRTMAC